MRRARSLALASTGIRMAARMAIMAMTINSSIRVKALTNDRTESGGVNRLCRWLANILILMAYILQCAICCQNPTDDFGELRFSRGGLPRQLFRFVQHNP